jgi:hypothetical protein
MTDLIDSIGPYLGVAAFLGLAILAFLTIQQAREVRRLREWAGRAPEAAGEAVEAEVAVAEAKGEEPEPVEVEEAPPSRIAMCPRWHSVVTRCPTSAGSSVSWRDFTQSMKSCLSLLNRNCTESAVGCQLSSELGWASSLAPSVNTHPSVPSTRKQGFSVL